MEAVVCEEKTEHVLFPRSNDLPRGFSGGFSSEDLAEEADSDEIDLGLSLGGCFSSADSKQKRIFRSSSIASLLPRGLQPVIPLSRASSLPSKTEEMWRKEMQSISRVDAKRKMEERNGRESFEEGESMAKFRKLEVPNVGSWTISGGPQNTDFSPTMSRWRTEALPPDMSEKYIPPTSRGSIASQGSISPGGSDSKSHTELGFSNGSEVREEHKNHKAASFRSKPAKGAAFAAVGGGLVGGEKPPTKIDGGRGRDCRGAAEEMPAVSTRGNGRRIHGFLYKYGSGEVRILCVCHGSFLTPAEFVKHSGGGDVAHPLKHIVVNPSSPPFL